MTILAKSLLVVTIMASFLTDVLVVQSARDASNDAASATSQIGSAAGSLTAGGTIETSGGSAGGSSQQPGGSGGSGSGTSSGSGSGRAPAQRPSAAVECAEVVASGQCGYGPDQPSAGSLAEGPFEVGLDIVPGPIDPEYVPSQAEIDATILAAFDSVAFPDFDLKTAPPGDLNAPLITQLATFLWVDDSEWQPISASASIPGYFTVTAVAVPTTMTWSGGETGPVWCAPPGVEWYPGAPEHCVMTYKSSSATYDHYLKLEVDWEVSYSCTAFCSGGTLPTHTTEAVRDVRVAEIQAIVTSGG